MQKDKNVIFTVKQEDVNAIGQLIVWNQVHRILGDGNLKKPSNCLVCYSDLI